MTMVREALLGPSYFHHRRLIEESRNWSPGEIAAYQEKRLAGLLGRYGEQITVRDDYQRNVRRYTRWDIPPVTRTVRTGGTSGQPLRFKADRFGRRQKERAYLFDIWSRVGYVPHSLRVVYRGGADRHLLRFDSLENAWIVSPSATLEERLDTLRGWVGTLPPFFLHVYPSSLMSFIDLVGEGLFRSLPVRGVLAGSEAFPIEEQKRFEQDFGLRIAHWYGHSEYAALAYCCRSCSGFHFYPTYGHVELLPSDTEDCFRIIASSFNRLGTQFVRYDTGDLALAPAGRCPDPFPRVGSIAGRSQETFIDSSGRKRALGPYVFGIHGRFWDEIRDLQFVQENAGSLLVRLVARPDPDRNRIQRALQQSLPMVRLTFDYVPAVSRGTNGKRVYFVTGPLPTEPRPQASRRDRARRPANQRGLGWITAFSAALAAVIVAVTIVATWSVGDRARVIRPHPSRVSIVNVKDRHNPGAPSGGFGLRGGPAGRGPARV